MGEISVVAADTAVNEPVQCQLGIIESRGADGDANHLLLAADSCRWESVHHLGLTLVFVELTYPYYC